MNDFRVAVMSALSEQEKNLLVNTVVDEPEKEKCERCKGAGGYFQRGNLCDSEPKPWKVCSGCKGTGLKSNNQNIT